MAEALTWRAATAADEPLLFSLFAAGKSEEFTSLGLAPEQLLPLLNMQFRARQASYAQQFPHSLDMILCLPVGTAVGHHLIERRSDEYRGIDLAVLPEHRSRGIGAWALQQVQQLAAAEGVPFRLRVLRSNRARNLYERTGFLAVSADEISFEMEWTPRSANGAFRASVVSPMLNKPSAEIPCDGSALPRQDVLDRIFAFLREIGLTVQVEPVPSSTFLPGIQMIANGLRVDPDTLLYPGDLLHEAGHLALMTPVCRSVDFPSSNDAAEEIGTLAWSYAAAIHLGLPPEIVFHEGGYKGQARSLIAEFRDNPRPIGVPFLWWVGLTTQEKEGQPSIFPKMLRWLRLPAADAHAEDSERGRRTSAVLPWVRLPFFFDPAPLQAEVAAIPESEWQAHFNQNDYEGRWSIVALRSRSGAAADIVPQGGANEFQDTPLLARCPALRAVLANFRFPLKSVRLMRLHAGSRIHEHRDRDLKLAGGELRLHVPVVTSDAVEFVVSGERLPLRPGECWYIDFSQPHRITNGGTEHRIHLVIDGVADEEALLLLQGAEEQHRSLASLSEEQTKENIGGSATTEDCLEMAAVQP